MDKDLIKIELKLDEEKKETFQINLSVNKIYEKKYKELQGRSSRQCSKELVKLVETALENAKI